jgi:hypothetical protein
MHGCRNNKNELPKSVVLEGNTLILNYAEKTESFPLTAVTNVSYMYVPVDDKLKGTLFVMSLDGNVYTSTSHSTGKADYTSDVVCAHMDAELAKRLKNALNHLQEVSEAAPLM